MQAIVLLLSNQSNMYKQIDMTNKTKYSVSLWLLKIFIANVLNVFTSFNEPYIKLNN